jgi:hypothetical protein
MILVGIILVEQGAAATVLPHFRFWDTHGQNCGKLAGEDPGVRHLESTLAEPSIGRELILNGLEQSQTL